MKRILKIGVLFILLSLILVSFKLKPKDDGFVDLGLSVKWATCNVGAKSPTDYGEYYTFDKALQLENNEVRLPTEAEFKELIDNCIWLWTEENDVKGHKVTSKKNGNCIFLPAAGYRYGEVVYNDGSYGYYWSSSVYDDDYAHCLGFKGSYVYTSHISRDYGLSVRLVR